MSRIVRPRRAPEAPNTPARAIGYVRVSTEEQVLHGVSLDAQEERVRAYCTAAGLELVALIREEGVSAAKPLASRPGGQGLLEAIAAGMAGNVVALKLDRLFRDAADCLVQTRTWDQAGVAMHLIDMGGTAINTASAMGRMFLTMAAGFAELERNLISERTCTALAYKKAQGVKLGGVRETTLLADAPTLERIRALRAAGQSTRAIAATLTAEGFTTRRGGRWASETVRKILGRMNAGPSRSEVAAPASVPREPTPGAQIGRALDAAFPWGYRSDDNEP